MTRVDPRNRRQGVDLRTWRRLEVLGRQLRWGVGEISTKGEPLDVYSSIGRPGSWEYQTQGAKAMRRILHEAGYQEAPDPEASHRVRWTR